ncbi:lysylphosphatidylglycerol synthase transmembrane domain-containing protein [Dictyobacter kobayashii]|uniref:TIGR00374 family protein n=1 Tax=Dictyobacter kobayashii TaxID=2014872 RepID=A0A402ALW9_9CHLR|nr:lysylphosphatidylglycerol synthase transmembrane domain-containing protein [Dictyobacter kobayashii]GCE20035.1 TIGR00374 family protein [Dictyobacter kobayashii]
MFTRRMRTGIIFSLVLAFIVIIAIALYADLPRMVEALTHFRWVYIPLILGFTLVNYAGRFIKWQYYLKRLKIAISGGESLWIFLAGLSMAITPGKVGELLKSYLLKRSTGVPISRTSPIIVAERLSDGIAMLVLAAAGLFLYGIGWEILLLLLVLGLGGIILIQNRPLVLSLLQKGERLPLVSKFVHLVREFYESTYTLLQWRPLLLAICIGIISWSGECAALYFVYSGLGIAAGPDLFIKSMFILAVSSLIGSASGLPGGLGTADGSMLGLTHLLVTTSATLGGAATLLIRLCTLWFGLLIGVMALLRIRWLQRRRNPGPLDSDWDEHKQKHGVAQPIHDDLTYATMGTSASTSTGEKFV